MMALALLPLGAALWLGLDGQQWWPLAVLLSMSLLTVAAYAWDKRQAVRGEWRIPESRLHLLELCGGWPGALVARQWLRHKTLKRSYRLVFWFIVLLHLTLWALWVGRPLWQQ
ncbi:DUF1294 domain-containing protein [Aeromonas veronii]|uniref:DUF1294 domain-containing protein n=1 Tax=Aeromonas veronii TaxID=654 RepID=UPI002B4A19A2|nr:DUF1294 domain-containing protein [Aeromonas veronii]